MQSTPSPSESPTTRPGDPHHGVGKLADTVVAVPACHQHCTHTTPPPTFGPLMLRPRTKFTS